jgi:Uma2 family endonuclease
MALIADNPTESHLKRWTKQEYRDLVANGFVDGSTTFLYRGELVDKSPEGELVPKLWTKREFIDKVERGFLTKQRVFLLRGELVEMASMGALHWHGLRKLNYWLTQNFLPEFDTNTQAPFEAFDESMPQPDGAVYTKAQVSRHPCPNSAPLIIELSDSSIELDREMAGVYAASGVQEYWIANLRDRNIEIFRDAVSDPASITGFRYALHRIAMESEEISPLAKADASLRIADLLIEK